MGKEILTFGNIRRWSQMKLQKKVVRHIHDSLSDFSYFNNESDEE